MKDTRIFIKVISLYINLDKIIYFKENEHSTEIYLTNGEIIETSQTLEELLNQVNEVM